MLKWLNIFKKKKEIYKEVPKYVQQTTILDNELVINKMKEFITNLDIKGNYFIPSVVDVKFIFDEENLDFKSLIPNMINETGEISLTDILIKGMTVITVEILSKDGLNVYVVDLEFADSSIDGLEGKLLINANSLIE